MIRKTLTKANARVKMILANLVLPFALLMYSCSDTVKTLDNKEIVTVILPDGEQKVFKIDSAKTSLLQLRADLKNIGKASIKDDDHFSMPGGGSKVAKGQEGDFYVYDIYDKVTKQVYGGG